MTTRGWEVRDDGVHEVPTTAEGAPDWVTDTTVVELTSDERHFADNDEEPHVPPGGNARERGVNTGRQLVEQYLARGFQPVFWPDKGEQKGPFEKARIDKRFFIDDYEEGDRVGIMHGVEVQPGRYLVDVDIDWGPGVEIAKAMLPTTGVIWGRQSKRISHCLYVTPDIVSMYAYKDVGKDGITLTEFRADKHQSMAPPSIWEKGGRREPLTFVSFNEPTLIESASKLKQRVCLAAIGMLLAKNLGKNGFGHDVRLAWAGFLLRLGVPPDDLIAMGEAIPKHCNNREVADVRVVVLSTVASLNDDAKKVKGGPALAEMLGANGPAVISLINKWLGRTEGPQLIIHKASEVPDKDIEKEFGGRLVRGSFALLAGPGDVGKGMFLVDVAARFTTGEPFPGETTRRDPANVITCVTEDSKGRVKSRLRAAGADLDRVFFVEGPEVTRGGLTMASPMMLDDDAHALVRYAEQIDARALFLETVVEHFGDREGKSRRSTNNEADVRSALSPFRAVCGAGRLYGLSAIHPRKSVEGSIDDSISGSAAFRNVTRALHHIYRDPKDESNDPVRLLFTSKSNYLSRRPTTLRFRIKSWDQELCIPCVCHQADCGHEGRIVWEKEDLVDKRLAEEIWQQIAARNKPRRDVHVQEAEEFLTGLMQGDIIEMVPQEIYKRASAEGITKAAVKRAEANLRLVSKKGGFPAVVVGWQMEKGQM